MAKQVLSWINGKIIKLWCIGQGLSLRNLSDTIDKYPEYVSNSVAREKMDEDALSKIVMLTGIQRDVLTNRNMTLEEDKDYLIEHGLVSNRYEGQVIGYGISEEPYNESIVTREEFTRHAGEANRKAHEIEENRQENEEIHAETVNVSADIKKPEKGANSDAVSVLLNICQERLAKGELQIPVIDLMQITVSMMKGDAV